jgi:chromosomal replication initiation ATPase DnaA
MNVPRFSRSPIDTSVYNFYMIKRKPLLNLVERIRYIIAYETGIDPYSEVKYRKGELIKSRQYFCYFVRKYAKLSQSATGRLIGKDHATVLYAERCVEMFKETEKSYLNTFNEIERKIEKLINR